MRRTGAAVENDGRFRNPLNPAILPLPELSSIAQESHRLMPLFDLPDGTVVVVPFLSRAWVSLVRDVGGHGGMVTASNAEDLLEEAAAFLRSFGITDLDGTPIRICPPELAAKAIFPEADAQLR
jgi:hypothetical protein